jgi:hypothetical protein
MKTYIGESNKPLIRSCANCINFKQITHKDDKTGYCKAKPLMFAYTMNYNVYAIVKSFCLCEDHLFFNEDILKRDCEQVEMKDILVNKNELAKNK